MQVNIKNLIDDVQCYQTVRALRWPDGIACPLGAGHPQPRQGWRGGRDGMGLHRAHAQRAQAGALTGSAGQQRTAQCREGMEKKPTVTRAHEGACEAGGEACRPSRPAGGGAAQRGAQAAAVAAQAHRVGAHAPRHSPRSVGMQQRGGAARPR